MTLVQQNSFRAVCNWGFPEHNWGTRLLNQSHGATAGVLQKLVAELLME